ncbi:MAG: DUF4864 domain-containing protein [Fibrella sp.]|nr:DUF4864 domain-containing protein [Armatimonadota bacterium]
MSMTTEPKNDASKDAPWEKTENPPSRRRILLYAAAPVALLVLLMTGVRFVTEAAQKLEANADAKDEQALKSMRPNDPASRPTPIPVKTYQADKVTQTALETVVRGQLKAIEEQDFERALTFAVPGMRKATQPNQFGSMIRSSYSTMTSPKKITLLPAKIQERPGTIRQALVGATIISRTGAVSRYVYIIVRETDGWKIAGVVPDRNEMMDRKENSAPMPRQGISDDLRDL